MTQTFHEKLAAACHLNEDGRWQLPDRRILIQKGDKFTLIGHRDKRKLKIIRGWPKRRLINYIIVANKSKRRQVELQRLDKEQLVRILYPRPKQYFCLAWLTSGSPQAVAVKKLINEAEKM